MAESGGGGGIVKIFIYFLLILRFKLTVKIQVHVVLNYALNVEIKQK